MSEEDQQLLEKISKISGHINLHKTQATSARHDPNSGLAPPSRAWNRYTKALSDNPSAPPWRSSRVAPYGRGRGRAGRLVANPHRHRTLVLNNASGASLSSAREHSPESTPLSTKVFRSEDEDPVSLPLTNRWVTKRDRHMQLINSSVYEKETQTRNKAMEETRRQKAFRKDQREKQKIERHLNTLTPRAGQATNVFHELLINGLRFQVADGGSKLVRIRGENHDQANASVGRSQLLGINESVSTTPKHANIGGVTFLRSKNGNLYRSGIVEAKRARGKSKKIAEPCNRFTSTGQCPKGPQCPYLHDPLKVAMCKDYLQTGTCAAGDSCDLSHDHTPERVPACLHYLRGKCSNPSCRYAHVRVNPSASVCKDFAILGYCSKGANCSERHVHECPDYAKTGVCRKPKCHLPHIDRAGQIRKHAANITDRANTSEEADDSDIVSDDNYDEIDSDDVESEGLEEDMMQASDDTASHILFQQQDFVQF